jgi:sec-independent protein translocase protein TatA
MFNGIGGSEILLIVIAVLVLFGSRRLPGLARTLGKASREVRRTTRQLRSEIERAGEDNNDRPSPPDPDRPG